jgi:hypothetical protein
VAPLALAAPVNAPPLPLVKPAVSVEAVLVLNVELVLIVLMVNLAAPTVFAVFAQTLQLASPTQCAPEFSVLTPNALQ